jgi:anti-anti-sigma regulatory factor
VTCRIERLRDGEHGVLRVCGHVQAEHVATIEALIASELGPVVLDLAEVTLVDRAAVRALARCERSGIELGNCPPFLREWMSRERSL